MAALRCSGASQNELRPMWLSKALDCLFVSLWGICLLGGFAAGLYLSIWGAWEVMNGICSSDWPKTEGTVVSADLFYGEDDSWWPHIVYAYALDGKEFRGERLRYDGGGSRSSDRNAYPVGKAITVRYHPSHSDRSVLEPGFNPWALFIFGVGMVFIIGTSVITVLLVCAFARQGKDGALERERG